MVQWQTQFDQLRRDHRTPLVITALLALLLLLAIWQLINTIASESFKKTATAAQTTAPHLPNVANLHLFGVFSANLDSLPTTTLQLTLQGTVVSLDLPAQSYALIGSPGATTKVYRMGDTLPGNATINHITKDYIILDDNGALEKLALPVPPLLTGEK